MKKLLSVLLSLAMVFALAVPALAAAPEADLDPPLWRIYGYDSYEEMIDIYIRYSDMTAEEAEADYAGDLAYILNFMETRPEETARLRASAYDYYEAEYSSDYGAPEEFMSYWGETEEQFVTEMAAMQIIRLRYAEEYAAQWAQTCAEQPERTARFLAELEDWFAEEYSWYDSLEEYCEYYYCVEEAYLELFHEWNWNYEWEQRLERERDEFITAHGGVPGQFNVMVNGTFLPSPDGRPVYIENGVTYADAQALSRALGVSVTANAAGYAPVRAVAEAQGCTVSWDSTYNAAVVLDPAALAGKIDSSFTLLNRYMDNGISADANYLMSGQSDAELTVFNSLDGDMTRQASFAYDFTVSPTAVSGSMDYDLSLLWDLLQTYIPALLAEEQDDGYEQRAALLTALLSGRVDLRADLEEGMAYVSLPSFLPNTWLRCPVEDSADLDELRSLYGEVSSIGQLLSAAALDSYVEPARRWDSAMEAADEVAALVGDEKFVRDGTARVLTLTADDILAAMGEDMDYFSFSLFSFTLQMEDSGSVKLDLNCRLAITSDGLSTGDVLYLSVSGTRAGGKTQSAAELHIRNMFKLVLKQELTLKETKDAPKTTPPQGAVILDAEDLENLEF